MPNPIPYRERVAANSMETYGSCCRISKYTTKAFIVSLGLIVPVVLPLPLMAFLARFAKNDLVLRWS
jgi:hypothetical protein